MGLVEKTVPETGKDNHGFQNSQLNLPSVILEEDEDEDRTSLRSIGSWVIETEKPVKELKGCKRYWGLCLGLLSSFIFSLATLSVKVLSNYHPYTVTLWRLQGIFWPSVIICFYTVCIQRKNVFEDILPPWNPTKSKLAFFLFLRATTGTIATVFFNYALIYMTLPDASVIAFSTPVFATFLAFIFLKETCGFVNVFAAIVTVAGVVVIIRPPFLSGENEINTELLIGAIMAFASMFLSTCVYLFLRVLKGLNYSVVTFVFGLVGSIECVILCAIVDELKLPETSWDWLVAIALALSTFLGQVCSTLATKYEEAGIVALTRTFDVVFAFVWQFLFLNIMPNIFSLIGSLVVITGIVLVVIQKYLQNLDKDHPARKTFCLLLK